VLVQGNDFRNNLQGITVQGDGSTAGTIDLGGGPLGSSGGNNFQDFTTATGTSWAIGLFYVSPSYTVSARGNLFSVNPASVIADGSHDPAAGGSGQIIV